MGETVEWHTTFKTYNDHPNNVKELCKVIDCKKNFDTLMGHKNLVLSTKPAMGAKCQAFSSFIRRIHFLLDDMHH